MSNLKTAKIAFTKARAAYKTAQEDMAMPGQEKDQMAEQIIALADELVTVAIESVEGGSMGNEMTTPESGVADPTQDISTDIPDVTDMPNQKLNTAMGNHDTDPTKQITAKEDDDDDTNKEVKEMRKELDAMKAEKVAIRLAQKYSELYPMAMRSAMKEAFLSHKEPTLLLEARLDEASTIMGKPQAIKIAQHEDSVFNFDDLDDNTTTLDTGAKI